MTPSHDMPTCPSCSAPNGSTLDAQMVTHSAPIVQCSVCQHTWESVEDYERARVADAAWLAQEAKEAQS